MIFIEIEIEIDIEEIEKKRKPNEKAKINKVNFYYLFAYFQAMKNISKFFKNIGAAVARTTDKYEHTDATSTFYKKVKADDANTSQNTSYSKNSKVVVENRIPGLERMLVREPDKSRLIIQIEQTVYQANFRPIPPKLQDACEIVHYHLMNDLPVRVNLVKMILPDINVSRDDVVNEERYEEWLKHKHGRDAADTEIEIEDTYSMNVEGGKGKKAPDQWGFGQSSDNDWTRKK